MLFDCELIVVCRQSNQAFLLNLSLISRNRVFPWISLNYLSSGDHIDYKHFECISDLQIIFKICYQLSQMSLNYWQLKDTHNRVRDTVKIWCQNKTDYRLEFIRHRLSYSWDSAFLYLLSDLKRKSQRDKLVKSNSECPNIKFEHFLIGYLHLINLFKTWISPSKHSCCFIIIGCW